MLASRRCGPASAPTLDVRERLASAGAGLRRRDGHHAARGRRLARSLAARAEPVARRPGALDPPRLHRRRRRHHRDQHVRRQPLAPGPLRPVGPDARELESRRRAPGARSAGAGRPAPRLLVAGSVSPATPAGLGHRLPARELRDAFREQIEAPVRGRHRPAAVRDVRQPGRAGRSGQRGARASAAVPDRGADDVCRGRPHARRRQPRGGRHDAGRASASRRWAPTARSGRRACSTCWPSWRAGRACR